MDNSWLALIALSFCLSLVAIWANRMSGFRRNDTIAVQAAHHSPTSRFGGLAIFLAIAMYLMYEHTGSVSPLLQNFICALSVIIVGAVEDAGFGVKPRGRLLAAAAGSVLFIALSGAVLDRAGFSPLDSIFEFQIIAVPITVFALVGATHSFNLLDGLNGLCGLNSVVIGLALMVISEKAGHAYLGQSLIPVLIALAGFLLLNFPGGLLFLGDAGATGLGFLLACVAVEMLKVQSELSPWALLLVFFWPVADTLWTITRRLMRRRATARPDRMHFHQVTMRSFEILVLRRRDRAVSNPIATMILLPLFACPTLAGIFLWNQSEIAFVVTAMFAALFVASYQAIILRAKHKRRSGVLSGRPARRRSPSCGETQQ
jgi:UDP-N-acetylmuramyl pentapeptide phosphotransferase/UDP-N-acetylglucosamine-1-phosphate transferase